MSDSYDLSKLGTDAFENIVNLLALNTLGLGVSSFGPGPDGGRDGYFEGEAPYPSTTEQWKGVWFIQSKFHAPHLSKDPQKWLVEQVSKEIQKFDNDGTDRNWPNNWIIATNIDPSGKPETGSFDKIRQLLNKSSNGKKVNLNVWGGRKILDMLTAHENITQYYGHLLTPGHVISSLYKELTDKRASLKEIIRYFVATQFAYHTYSKLDQAGSSTDDRPGVHDLFIDLPFSSNHESHDGLLSELCKTSAHSHRYSLRDKFPKTWKDWLSKSKRARVILVKGGPGQGKSTIGQYLCQIHRAYLILSEDGPNVNDLAKDVANQVRDSAKRDGFWPTTARIPIQIELKEFAHWYSQRTSNQSRDVINYISETVAKKIGSDVSAKTIKSVLGKQSWIVVFDGLDEVPNDSKSDIAEEVLHFLNDVVVEIDGDIFSLCTSRPQGYSGQFSALDGPTVELSLLDADKAMCCAMPLLKYGRNTEDAEKSVQILSAAIESPNVKELMTTPLQSHIMAVVVRDGGRPPERRWQLFNSFYLVMKKRESLKDFKNPRIAKLLREDDLLLKSVHMRLGFVLHAKAERSEGAQTTLKKKDFRELVREVVTELVTHEISETVEDVMEATTERLVLVSTPEIGEEVRFDIRQLQEFFAAEFLYTGVDSNELGERIETIGGDEHWREVMHFLMSALIENQRTTDVAVAVEELRKLNEGKEPNDLYHRRIAKSVLLSSRLLIEGVLEQDQRVRQRIKSLVDPLGGKFDLESLRSLRYIKPTNSKFWLVQLLLEKIATANPDEYMGALYLLAWLLPDDHAEISKVNKAFIDAPIQLQEYLLNSWKYEKQIFRGGIEPIRDVSNSTFLSEWVTILAINILNSPDWVNYSPVTISNLQKICFFNEERFLGASSKAGMSTEAANAVQKSWKDESPVHIRSDDLTKINFGVLSASPYSENWNNGNIPERIRDIDCEKYIDELNGLFRLMLLCTSFAKKQSDGVLTELAHAFDSLDADQILCLPSYLLALVPMPDRFSSKPFNIDHLRTIKTFGYNEGVLKAKKVGIEIPLHNLSLNEDKSKTSPDDWLTIAKRFSPSLTLDLIFHVYGHNLFRTKTKNSIKRVTSTLKIRKLIIDNPKDTFSQIGSWGILNDHDPQLLVEIKQSMKALSEEDYKTERVMDFGLHPFTIALPDDSHLLPLISQVLIPSPYVHHLSTSSEESLSKTFSLYGLTAVELRSISKSVEFDQASRAGALALFWLLLSEASNETTTFIEKLDLLQEKALYVELVNEFNERWLTQSLINGVLINSKDTDDNSVAFVSYLLERCKYGKGPRNELIKLIRTWQERSSAPVNSKQVLTKWLGYNFEPPSYINPN
jgi:hypothetical protein